jgi:hypothetical protein
VSGLETGVVSLRSTKRDKRISKGINSKVRCLNNVPEFTSIAALKKVKIKKKEAANKEISSKISR